jgi:hypothetical protein
MQFLLVDVSSTIVFLLGYLTVAAVRQRRTTAAAGTRDRASQTRRNH